MDFTDPVSSTEFADEHLQNEVVPSSETSISDNKITTTIAEHKQSSVDVPSNGTNGGAKNQLHTSGRKVFETNAIEQESDGGGSTSGLKSESDTESESRLVIQSENETTDNDTASTRATTTLKENGGSASVKPSAKRKSSAKQKNKQADSNDNSFGDGIEFSDDEEKFCGFTTEELKKCKSWSNVEFFFIIKNMLKIFPLLLFSCTSSVKQVEYRILN